MIAAFLVVVAASILVEELFLRRKRRREFEARMRQLERTAWERTEQVKL